MKHLISVVAIFRDEHRYIAEWVKYHLKVGVTHFYLYDNGADHWEELKHFSDNITYVPWTDEIAAGFNFENPKLSRQTKAYTHCLKNFGQDTEWLQLLDLDEFMVPITSDVLGDCLPTSINDDVSGIRIPRLNFGNSGHWFKSKTGSVTAFDRRERTASHYKDLGIPSKVRRIKNPHSYKLRKNLSVLETKNIFIHHHYTRSLREWLDRANRGGGQAGKGFRNFIGKRSWLAFATYFFLNIRSIVPLVLFISLSFLIAFGLLSSWFFLLDFSFLIWFLFAWRRGQNEVFDPRLRQLFES